MTDSIPTPTFPSGTTPLTALPAGVKKAYETVRTWVDKARPACDKARGWVDQAAALEEHIQSGILGTVVRMVPALGPISASISFTVQAADAVVDVIDSGIDAVAGVIDALDPNNPAPALPQAQVGP